MKTEHKISLFLIIPALLLFLAAGIIGAYKWNFIQNSQVIEGNVIELDSRTTSEGGNLYYPVLEFTKPNGQSAQFTSKTGTSSNALLGEQIELIYNQDFPDKTIINRFIYIWLAVIVPAGIGLISFSMGFLLYWVNRPPRKNKTL